MNSSANVAGGVFVGRERELAVLRAAFDAACAGRGRLVMLVGEPGIGKTRTAEQFAAIARQQGALVLRGGCHEGEWAPPYGPFAEAITAYAGGADADHLRHDLGFGSGSIARIVPALHERLPDIAEPAALQPDEERFRLLDAVCQFLIALSVRAPLVLMLDDCNWADQGTVAMLRHVTRFAPRHRMLLLGTYSDVEIDREARPVDALAGLRRVTNFERIHLKGLKTRAVRQLLETPAHQRVPDPLVEAIATQTGGNPFFIRELMLHLVEEGKIFRRDEGWHSTVTIEAMGIPEGVRQVVDRRLSRLAEHTQRWLTVAAAFNGVFRLDIVAAVAGLDAAQGLSAVEEALSAQMLRPVTIPDTYDFTHALIRHALYAELSPAQQVRVHRQIAEVMERVYGDASTGSRQGLLAAHARGVAYQYSRSAALPGAEKGVGHALSAADQADAAYALEQVVTDLRLALRLLPPGDTRYPRMLARLGLALPWIFAFDEAVRVAGEAGRLLAEVEGPDAAADYLGEATASLGPAGSLPAAMELARQGMQYIGDRRDLTWLRLASNDLQRREQAHPEYPGLPPDSPERRELSAVAATLPLEHRRGIVNVFPPLASRAEALREWAAVPVVQTLWVGDFRRVLPGWEERAAADEREGRIDAAATALAYVARCRLALGEVARAHEAYKRGAALAARLPEIGHALSHLTFYSFERCMALDDGWQKHAGAAGYLATQPSGWNLVYAAAIRVKAAVISARLGQVERALDLLGALVEALDRAPAWSPHYTAIACGAATTLWLLECTDHVDVIERNLREKVVAPDFRYPMRDGRLSVARVCALQGRYDEAAEWFARARTVLDQQGARPLRAIVDFDEALMYLRRASEADKARAHPFLAVALQQFRALSMTGWIGRTESIVQNDRDPAPVHAPQDARIEGSSKPDPRRLGYELGRAFAERLQLEDLIPFAVARCRELLNAEGVGVLFLDRPRAELYFPYVADEDPAVASRLLEARFPADRGIAGTALLLGKSLRVDDPSADPRFFGGVDKHTGRATRALLCTPFTSHGGVSGLIEAVNPRGAEVFSDDDLALLDAFAQSLGNAFDNLKTQSPHAAIGDDESSNRDQGLATAGAVFRKEGEYWTIAFEGRIARLKDAKGLHYLAHLLRNPGQELHVRDLLAVVGETAQTGHGVSGEPSLRVTGFGDAGSVLDTKAKAAYKRRLDDLHEELAEAERFNDPGRVSRAREEIELITQQLTAAVGLGGRDRIAASDAERARLAVTKRIKAALAKIHHANPALARHLTAAITTGYFCSYAPKADTPTSWVVE